jgi:hypothetical protein
MILTSPENVKGKGSDSTKSKTLSFALFHMSRLDGALLRQQQEEFRQCITAMDDLAGPRLLQSSTWVDVRLAEVTEKVKEMRPHFTTMSRDMTRAICAHYRSKNIKCEEDLVNCRLRLCVPPAAPTRPPLTPLEKALSVLITTATTVQNLVGTLPKLASASVPPSAVGPRIAAGPPQIAPASTGVEFLNAKIMREAQQKQDQLLARTGPPAPTGIETSNAPSTAEYVRQEASRLLLPNPQAQQAAQKAAEHVQLQEASRLLLQKTQAQQAAQKADETAQLQEASRLLLQKAQAQQAAQTAAHKEANIQLALQFAREAAEDLRRQEAGFQWSQMTLMKHRRSGVRKPDFVSPPKLGGVEESRAAYAGFTDAIKRGLNIKATRAAAAPIVLQNQPGAAPKPAVQTLPVSPAVAVPPAEAPRLAPTLIATQTLDGTLPKLASAVVPSPAAAQAAHPVVVVEAINAKAMREAAADLRLARRKLDRHMAQTLAENARLHEASRLLSQKAPAHKIAQTTPLDPRLQEEGIQIARTAQAQQIEQTAALNARLEEAGLQLSEDLRRQDVAFQLLQTALKKRSRGAFGSKPAIASPPGIGGVEYSLVAYAGFATAIKRGLIAKAAKAAAASSLSRPAPKPIVQMLPLSLAVAMPPVEAPRLAPTIPAGRFLNVPVTTKLPPIDLTTSSSDTSPIPRLVPSRWAPPCGCEYPSCKSMGIHRNRQGRSICAEHTCKNCTDGPRLVRKKRGRCLKCIGKAAKIRDSGSSVELCAFDKGQCGAAGTLKSKQGRFICTKHKCGSCSDGAIRVIRKGKNHCTNCLKQIGDDDSSYASPPVTPLQGTKRAHEGDLNEGRPKRLRNALGAAIEVQQVVEGGEDSEESEVALEGDPAGPEAPNHDHRPNALESFLETMY